jgi:hypothetical protein
MSRRYSTMTLPRRPFIFVRHGQTDWNKVGRIQGDTDIPLNLTGLAQARGAAQLIDGVQVDLIVSSPLRRAVATAHILADATTCPVVIDEGLKERSFGAYEGCVQADARPLERLPYHPFHCSGDGAACESCPASIGFTHAQPFKGGVDAICCSRTGCKHNIGVAWPG